jgi:hypothetical protein
VRRNREKSRVALSLEDWPSASSVPENAGQRRGRPHFRVRGDGRVDLHAPGVASAALHITVQQMAVDRIEHDLRNLRPGGIIEEDEARLLMERRKERTDSFAREGDDTGCERLRVHHFVPLLHSGAWLSSVVCKPRTPRGLATDGVSLVYKEKRNFPSHGGASQGMDGLRSLCAVSAPNTGSDGSGSKPICLSTEAWSQ